MKGRTNVSRTGFPLSELLLITALLLGEASVVRGQDAEAFSAGSGSAAEGSAEATPPAGEGSAAEGGSAPAAPSAALDEAEQVAFIKENSKYQLTKDAKDPFKPLLKKVLPLPPAPPPPVKNPNDNKPSVPLPPPVKPINVFVQGVCGNDGERLAMIVFENKTLTVTKDQVVDGKFKVVDILPDKLVVYSNKEAMRRTFPIGGGKE